MLSTEAWKSYEKWWNIKEKMCWAKQGKDRDKLNNAQKLSILGLKTCFYPIALNIECTFFSLHS